jgi:hypothetical protein
LSLLSKSHTHRFKVVPEKETAVTTFYLTDTSCTPFQLVSNVYISKPFLSIFHDFKTSLAAVKSVFPSALKQRPVGGREIIDVELTNPKHFYSHRKYLTVLSILEVAKKQSSGLNLVLNIGPLCSFEMKIGR